MQSSAYSHLHLLESENVKSETSCFPGLGIVATLFATIITVNVIPDDPQPEGALFLPALTMTLGIAIAPLLSAMRDPKALLRTEHLAVLAPIYWLLLDLLQGTYPLDGVQPDQVSTAFIGIGSFVVAVWVGAAGRAWRVPRSIINPVSKDFLSNTLFGLSVGAFVLGMLPFAIPTNFDLAQMIYYVGQNRWAAPWARGELGGWDAFLGQLQYFGYLLPMLTVIVANHSGWMKGRTLFCVVMSVIVTIFVMQSGSRRIIGVMFAMAMITWILTQRQLRTKQVLIAAVTSVVLLFTLEIMLDYRNVGLAALTEPQEPEQASKSTRVRIDDNFYRLCQIIELIPAYYPFVYREYFVYILIRPIPRVFWPGKPVDPGFDLSSAIGVRGTSLTASVIGELYMAGGFIAIALGGWFYGRLSGMASELLIQHITLSALVIYATLTMSLFVGMRSMVELVLMNYATVAWIVLLRLFPKGQRAS